MPGFTPREQLHQMNGSIASFFDALTGELQRLLAASSAEQVTVSWNRGLPIRRIRSKRQDLVWWSCTLSVDPACRICAGADRDGDLESRFFEP